MDTLYTNLKVGKPKDSEIEITGEIPAKKLAEEYEIVLSEIQESFEAPGFRKGKVPLEVIKQNVHEHKVLEDAAERALQEAYPLIIDAQSFEVLGRPEVLITKLAAGNPVEFKIRVGIRPEVKLPNYKKIAADVLKEQKPAAVSDTEVDEVIKTLQKMRMGAEASGEKRAESDNSSPESATEKTEEKLPELTDEFVKTLGNFENVSDFKTKLRENMMLEKESEARKGLREELAKKLVDASKIELPQLLVQEEAFAMLEQLKADLEHAKLSFEDYLKRAGQTEEEILRDQRDYAERQIKMRFILEEIAKEEKIEPNEKDVQIETKILTDRHPDTDPERIEKYVTTLLRNEAVIQFLEGKKQEAEAAPEVKPEA